MNTCILWTGAIDADGYGRTNIKVDGKWKGERAHRLAYIEAKGAIPTGLFIDHLCRVRHCINPNHLEAVTNAENIRRGLHPNGFKKHCKRGHPFDDVNTRIDVDNKRRCRTCDRAWAKANYQAKKKV